MKGIFAAIKSFIINKKLASALIGVAMIGGVSAAAITAGNVGANLTAPSSSQAVQSEQPASSVSSEASNIVVEANSSVTPVSAPSQGAADSKAGSSTVAKQPVTAADADTIAPTGDKSADLAAENTRHQNALASINNQYDPQIAALNNEIAGFQAEGARDMTDEINQYQSYYEQCKKL